MTNGWQKQDDEEINNEIKAEANAVSVNGTGTPSCIQARLRLGYDQSAKQTIEGSGGNVENWMAEVFTHVQILYMHHTLQIKVVFDVSVIL